MQELIEHGWVHLAFLLILALVTTYIMRRQGRQFYTKDPVKKKFSIMNLEFPGSAKEILNLVQGMYALPADESAKVLKALRGQLAVDFLFMVGAYLGIFVLCQQVSWLMPAGQGGFFMVLAWMQFIPWALDVTENLFLFNRIRKEATLTSPFAFGAYRVLEFLKWGISLFGLACGLSSMFYLWLTGQLLYSIS